MSHRHERAPSHLKCNTGNRELKNHKSQKWRKRRKSFLNLSCWLKCARSVNCKQALKGPLENESSESLHSSSGLLCNHVGVCGFVCLCLQNTLETCTICSKPIMERILRATGKAYHPHCFTCVVCHRSLDGIPFTVDASNHIHCIEDFHKCVA